MFERSKPGKRGRMIGDFTTEGSLLAGFLLEILKKSIAPYSHDGFYLEFVQSTEPSTLDRVCSMLVYDPRNCWFIFSDDMLAKINGKLYEIDISSCDASNSPTMFGFVPYCAGTNPQFRDVAQRAVEQCRLRIQFRDPQSKYKFRLKPVRTVQSSGTVLTTFINTLAAASIAISCQSWGANDEASVRAAAHAAGYIVTIDQRSCVAQCTLLKNGWDVDGSAKLALGAVYKAIGSCYGDVPGSGPLDARFDAFTATVASGYVHSGHYHLIRHLAERTSKRVKLKPDYIKHMTFEPRSPASDQFYHMRYGLTGAEISEMKQCLCLPHHLHRISAFRKVFGYDYGIAT
jgi:hypothetical protein